MLFIAKFKPIYVITICYLYSWELSRIQRLSIPSRMDWHLFLGGTIGQLYLAGVNININDIWYLSLGHANDDVDSRRTMTSRGPRKCGCGKGFSFFWGGALGGNGLQFYDTRSRANVL